MVRRLFAPSPLALGAAVVLAACPGSRAQTPPGLTIPKVTDARTATPDPKSPAGLRLALGDEAVKGGRFQEAVDHYVAALGFHPASPAILLKALRAAAEAEDDDARALWAYTWWLAAADARGKASLDRDTKELIGKDATALRKLATARVAAVEELARFARKLKTSGRAGLGQGVMARWATDVAWELVRPSPALWKKHAIEFRRACDRHEPDYDGVVQALRSTIDNAGRAPTTAARNGSEGEPDPAAEDAALQADHAAIGAARVLTGLAAQANFDKLEGPPPPDLDLESERVTRERLRAKIASRIGEPLTVEQLQQMTGEERDAFTEDHATWANPGVAVSPNGLYVVHTTCGHGTLLGTAQTIELHHRRLANWFGKDPFDGQPGLVRIVPEAEDLEAEDSPYWWAGGFQSGDLTTVRFSWGNIAGLGRGLTHELTHRFDGALFAFLPSWLIEGRAVWTGAAYGRADDTGFIENYLDHGSLQTPFIKGYGGVDKLEELIEGTIEDYRDNYSAGHALFVYLASWEKDGQKVYADKLQRFMRNARAGRKKPLQFFESLFADGEDGRPDGLEAFAKEFYEFFYGGYKAAWGEAEGLDWLDRYTTRRSSAIRSRLVLDPPSFSWGRSRAEPWFGQKHAARAGMLLADAGRPRPAAAALTWSLQTDGWDEAVVTRLANLLTELGVTDAAWVLRGRLRDAAGRGPAPWLAKLPKLSALLRAMGDAVTQHAAQGRVLTARTLGRVHNRLAALCGTEPVPMPELPVDSEPLHPLVEPPRNLGVLGWTEDRLTDYEERRVEGLWFDTEEGDLHVGRQRPRDNTGLLDERAIQRDAFVRTVEWQPAGHWVLKTRVHFTTSFVRGAFVIGNQRRDRNIRVGFSAGDFLFSIGRKEGATETDKAHLWIDAKWERDGWNLPNSSPRHELEFEKPSSFFDLEIRIDGPVLSVTANGKHVFSYTAPDAGLIEGSVGVAMAHGAVRLQRPTIQRLDRGAVPVGSDAAFGLDLARSEPTKLVAMLRRPTRGIAPSPNGTIVLMLPNLENQRRTMRRGLAALRVLKRHARNQRDYPQKWMLVLPASLDAKKKTELREAAEEIEENLFVIAEHEYGEPFSPQSWVLFVDGFGVLREGDSMGGARGLPDDVATWARRYRMR